MKVIKNFLSKKTHKKIYDIIFGNNFPLFYQDVVGGKRDKSDYMFTHIFYHLNRVNSDYYKDIVKPLLNNIEFTELIRAKLNFYTRKPNHIQTAYHVDYPKDKHTVALYSINTNNGYTLFKNGNRVKSIANQLLLFDGKLKHCSVNQTDKRVRVNININLRT